jgi:GTP pyrophosphokinase
MVGARVNGQLVTIDYVINNGDRVEIITSQNSKGPSRDWLNIVKSTQAKNKINQWFKSEFKDDNIGKGKELFLSYCKSHSIVPSDILVPTYMDTIMQKYGFRDWDSVYAAIGHGGLKEGQIINKMLEYLEAEKKANMTNEEVEEAVNDAAKKIRREHSSQSGIVVKGIHDVAVRFSKCCSPVPGDEIVGFVTRGRGISIHRTDCINVINLPEHERARMIDAQWQLPDSAEEEKYMADIKIYANDRNGLLMDISKIFTEKNINIIAMNTRTSKQGVATLQTSFWIRTREELDKVIERLNSIEGVIDIERTTN